MTTMPARTRTTRGLVAVAVLAAALTGSSVSGGASASAPGGSAAFVPITPCRLLDTRPGDVNVGTRSTPLVAGETHTVTATGRSGSCDIPTSATALSMNVVAINPSASSYLTVFPADVTRPTSSSLNWVAGQAPTPNAVTSALGTGGGLSLFNLAGTVDLAVDVVGYFVSAPAATGPAGPSGAQGPDGPAGVSTRLPNLVSVATSGGQFTSVVAALASITDAGPTNRYVIEVAPGTYDESTSIVLKDWVDIEGAGRDVTVLRSADPDGTIVTSGSTASISDLTVTNTGGFGIDAGVAGSDPLHLERVSIEVSGGTADVGVFSRSPLEVDDVRISVGTTTGNDVAGLIVHDTSATIDGLTVVLRDGYCMGAQLASAEVVLRRAQVWLQDCIGGVGLYTIEGELTMDDSLFSVSATTGGAPGLYLQDSSATVRSTTVGVANSAVGSNDIGLVTTSASTVFVSGSSIGGADGSIDNSGVTRVTTSFLSGGTSGMSGRCADVWNPDFTPFTCT